MSTQKAMKEIVSFFLVKNYFYYQAKGAQAFVDTSNTILYTIINFEKDGTASNRDSDIVIYFSFCLNLK